MTGSSIASIVAAPSDASDWTAANPSGGATRRLTAGLGGALHHFQDEALLARGQVNLITLDAIAGQMAGRWASRRPLVERFVDQLLGAELTGGAAHLWVSQTDVLVSHPALDRAAAQVACLRYLRKALQHFLASSLRAPEGLFQVASISADRIDALPVDIGELLETERRANLERDRAQAFARATEPFVASHGRAVRASCRLEPVLKLRPTSSIGFRLVGRVVGQTDSQELTTDETAGLAGVDILKIDQATSLHGLAQVREMDRRPATLIVPVSYVSLSSQRGRTETVALLKQARECVEHGVISEIFGIEGAPHATLYEAVSLIKPFALFVVARLAATATGGLRQLRGSGLRGLAFDCPPHEGDAELMVWAAATVARTKQVASSVLIYGAPSQRHAERFAAAGATHVTLKDSAIADGLAA